MSELGLDGRELWVKSVASAVKTRSMCKYISNKTSYCTYISDRCGLSVDLKSRDIDEQFVFCCNKLWFQTMWSFEEITIQLWDVYFGDPRKKVFCIYWNRICHTVIAIICTSSLIQRKGVKCVYRTESLYAHERSNYRYLRTHTKETVMLKSVQT